MAFKRPRGRPLKFENAEELQRKIEEYFALDKVHTISGLAVHLDCSRNTLCEYEDREDFRPDLADTVKRAKERCEAENDERAATNKTNPTWAIFSAKNNYGWRDQKEIDLTTQGDKINFTRELSDAELLDLAAGSEGGAGKA